MRVATTLTDCGVEPYGIALSPDGSWFAVSAFRSGSSSIYATATLQKLVEHQLHRVTFDVLAGRSHGGPRGHEPRRPR
jgi:hypothetical protein